MFDGRVQLPPSLVDFLVSPSLSADRALRIALLEHVLAHVELSGNCWRRVLTTAYDVGSTDVVVRVVSALHRNVDAVRTWAQEALDDATLPLETRLRLQPLLRPGEPAPVELCQEAADALLAGKALPPESLALLDLPQLWLRALRGDAFVAAATLLRSAQERDGDGARLERAEVMPFLERGLRHQKRGVR
eukprot:7382389-Prymnesium_polylepis.1